MYTQLKRLGQLGLMALLAVAFVACKKTVEGESNKYNNNVQAAKRMARTYPNYASYIEAELAEAEEAWKAVGDAGDEEAQIRAMANVNLMFRNGVSGQLQQAESMMEQVERKCNDLKQMDNSYRSTVSTILDEIDAAKRILKRDAANENEAMSNLDNAVQIVQAQNERVDNNLQTARDEAARQRQQEQQQQQQQQQNSGSGN